MDLFGQLAKVFITLTSFEFCRPPWVANDVKDLTRDLEERFYGQHIATSVIVPAIKGHIKDSQPGKALVLSLHGPVGVGKSFVAGIVAEHLFHQDYKSKFVHKLVGGKDFAHAGREHIYKQKLQEWVENGVRACERSLFIIEEVHEVPMGVLDVLKPYMDNHAFYKGVDYRKAIFILTSNLGYPEINRYALNHWQQGGEREDIRHKDMNELLSRVVFNVEGGLQSSSLIPRKMISALVAFLPLERHHVKQCARAEARRMGYSFTESSVEMVANEATYSHDLFSVGGCRDVEGSVSRIAYTNDEL